MTSENHPVLTVVENVEALHHGRKQHINSLIDRIDNVIQEFSNDARANGGICTYAEIVGTLTILSHDYLTRKR